MIKKRKNELNTQSVLSMKGSGYYSQKTAGAKNAIDSIQDLVNVSVSDLPKTEFLRFADYGSADGGTSQEFWFRFVKKIRENGDSRPIEILYTDLASNDFTTLFKTMQGLGEKRDFAYQKIFGNVFVHGCGTGFHQQLLSNETLSMGFSATAMHYVSEKPCHIQKHVHMVGANPQERKEFEDQAAKDWEAILLARAKELSVGGRFFCMNFGIDEQGRYLGNTGGHSMFDKFNEHWLSHFKEGLISEEEYISATFAQHYRTVEEFCYPFKNKESAVSKAGLRLLSCKTKLTKCPYKNFFENNTDKMTPLEYAKSFIPTTRSWSETVFKTALSRRKSEEAEELVDSFYKKYMDQVIENPKGHSMDYIHIIMEIEKT